MCNYSDGVEWNGIKKGRKEGRKEDLQNLMQNMKWNITQAMDALSIPKAERRMYEKMLKKQ